MPLLYYCVHFLEYAEVVEPILEDNLRIFTTFVSTGNSVELKCGIHGASEVIWRRRGHVIDDSISSDIKARF